MITKTQALRRTKVMLVREWNLLDEPLSTTNLRDIPPRGLGKNDNQVRALEGPIERVFFEEWDANVVGDNLVTATTVGTLRDKIYDGIPAGQRN